MTEKAVDITYEGYLLEKTLGKVLEKLIPQIQGVKLKRQYRVGNQRCDFAIVREDSEKAMIVYEFDGPTHYQSSHTFELDRQKDEILSREGVVVVRIPYFVQLAGPAVDYYLAGFSATSNVEFPHGFISKKAPLPTTFTDQGLRYFCWQLQSKMPRPVADAVWQSMIDRGVDERSLAYVPKFVFERFAREVHGDKYDYSTVPDVVSLNS